MLKLNVYKKENYEDIAPHIKPKLPDLGNNLYYMATYKEKGVMMTISKKAEPSTIVQIVSLGISKLIEDDKGLIQRIKEMVFPNSVEQRH